ncbi:unnamed protein product [Chironomus riparius]|uniref:CRAL-TRIO domain-containing protein n=2 Tax=Chironomus riparius TaxID=315576 RepID=A0A9P0NI35_9DIPT|nr:unnamed protein product [Chironomus riparius]
MYNKLEIADNEHFEDNEALKRKSIEEFTRFIKNHSFITLHFEIDENFALMFLRARRYVMPKVKELYERSFLFIKQNPDIFIINQESFDKSLELYDSGAIVVMKERDAFGRRIFLCATRKLDTSKFTVDDILTLISIIFYTMLSEEETQKNGIVFINDLTELSINHLKLFPYKMLKNFSSYVNVNAIRVKEIYAVGVPSIAVQLFKAIRFVLDDKNKNRLKVMSNVSKMWEVVDQNLMTKEQDLKIKKVVIIYWNSIKLCSCTNKVTEFNFESENGNEFFIVAKIF